jgi:4-hydroxybenzoate polyprenyltransferase
MILDYIKLARPDHWIKQLFILPGVVLALVIVYPSPHTGTHLILKIAHALIATSLIASANYVINEWLDRHFDKYHPVKKNRPAVSITLKAPIVWLEWSVLSIVGLIVAWFIGVAGFITVAILGIMGLIYNVKPVRTKDVVYLDVISESFNNSLRLLIGWFAIVPYFLPPSSVILGYWMAGAYLMSIKRYSEYRAINNPKQAGLYRKSFKDYTEQSLLNSSLFYAMFSVFLLGVFLVKYHIEYIIAVPFLCILYVIYFNLSFQKDSTAQAPEKLLKEKKLMIFVGIFIFLLGMLSFIKMPFLYILLNPVLIGV